MNKYINEQYILLYKSIFSWNKKVNVNETKILENIQLVV
jgi:hypothetical protein